MAPRIIAPWLALVLASPLACDKDEPKEASDAAASPSPAGHPGSSDPAAAVAALPAIELPGAVPASAAGVLVLRTPESLFATVSGFDLFGEPDRGDTESLRKEIDAYLEQRIGLSLSSVARATVFIDEDGKLAAIIEGSEGTPKGKRVGEHEGVPLLALGETPASEALLAQHEALLIVGQPEAVKRSVSAATGKAKSLRDAGGPLAELLTDDSEGVSLAAVVEVSALPQTMSGELRGLGIERALFRYGAGGLRGVATGPEASMKSLSTLVEGGMDQVVAQAESAKREAMTADDTMMGVGAIFGHHTAKRLRTLVQPKLDGGRLTVDVPIEMRDPMLMTAMAGIAAAIAIPAMTTYMRRSKTAEARVQIAKMFDASSVYFNEEHAAAGTFAILKGEGTSAAHQCPNDGRLEGSAGPTPPLSVNCNEGPGGRCVPVAGEPSGPGEYSMKLWVDHPVWSALNFQMEQGHAFHYDFRWQNDPTGFGACQFTAQAFGDLDDDHVYSTYERSGAADEMGVNAAAGLYIDQEVE